MHITLAMVLCLAVGPVWAEDAITSDAVKAAQEPSPEMARIRAAGAYAEAYAPNTAAAQSVAEHMHLGVDPNLPDAWISGGRHPNLSNCGIMYGVACK